DADVGKIHGNATAHGARTEDRSRSDLGHGSILWNVGHLGSSALTEKDMALRFGLIAVDRVEKDFPLALQARVDIEFGGGFHGVDTDQGRIKPRCFFANSARGSSKRVSGWLFTWSSMPRTLRNGMFSSTTRSAKAMAPASKSPST